MRLSTRSLRLICCLAAISALTLACGLSRAEETVAPPAPPSTPAAPTLAENQPLPSDTPAALAGTDDQALPLQLLQFGFGQEETTLGYGFMVENPNPDLLIWDTSYQVEAFDAAGALIGSTNGGVYTILPGQTLGVGGDLELSEGSQAASITVTLIDGTAQPTEYTQPFEAYNAWFQEGEYSESVLSEIYNPYAVTYVSPLTFAVLFDQAGNIIGGGQSYISFLPPQDYGATVIMVTHAGQVASVRVDAIVMDMEYNADPVLLPEGASDIQLEGFGFGSDDYATGYGVVLYNPNDAVAAINSSYMVIGYDADGRVLEVSEGYLDLLQPGESKGVAGGFYFADPQKVDHATVFVHPGEYIEMSPIPWFDVDQISYSEEGGLKSVFATVSNPYDQDQEFASVYAVLYDAEGTIIGGGTGYIDLLPASGSAEVEVYVYGGADPADIRIFVDLIDYTVLQ